MSYAVRTVLLFVLGLNFTYQSTAQSSIEYGSNDGKYIQVFDAELYYEEYGQGTPLILLHGGLGSISDFDRVIPELSKHFKIIPIDSPGHGRSQRIDSLSYQIMAEYIVELIAKLKLDKVNIAGYSDGAIVGLLVAHIESEKINKLIFGAGALNLKASTPQGLEILQSINPDIIPESMVNEYKNKSPDPEHWEEFVYDSKEMWLQEVWIPKTILPDIKSKVLILFGDSDQFIPLEHAIEVYSSIPKSELCILPKINRDVFNHPDLVNPILIDFLSKE